MKTIQFFFVAALVFLVAIHPHHSIAASPARGLAGSRLTENFDSHWLFLKANAANAEQVAFNDSAWRHLDLPQDWSIEGPFAETNPAGGAGAFLPSGVVWYRKHFTLPPADSAKRVTIEFDGVMANSDVWINGYHLGHRPYGYVSFAYELNGHLNFGGDNVIAVRADTSQQPASRWYAGAGIYRHVHLIVTDPVHLAQWGVFVSTPQVADEQATVRVQSEVTNQADAPHEISLRIILRNPAGRTVATAETAPQTVAPGTSAQFAQDLTVKRPERWDLNTPVLYHATVQVRSSGKILDDDVVPFGIREFHFDAATGFWLNGKNFKVKGVCLHEDGGAFGAAVPLAVWQDRLAELKKLGVNAIRTAHNPPAPDFLDLCDRMGFLVMDEMFDCWTVGKPDLAGHHLADYHLYFNDWSKIDLADTVRRDRNHPSIILYSAGNEIHDTPQQEKAKKILAGLLEVFHANDPTRPVTQALFRPNASHDYDDGLADMLDVIGQNYRENEILAAHDQKPTRKIIGTENRHDRVTWLALRDHPAYAGQFLWTGVDYLGESRRWPMVGHGSGLLDRTGAPRPLAFERQSWWSDQPMVSMARRISRSDVMPADPGYGGEERYTQVLYADWTPKNLQPHNENVEVYSNCKEVELFLNGKSLGSQPLHANASPRNWSVPFAPGVLKAVARDEKGKMVATDELRTAGPSAKIVLTADRKKVADNWDDVCEVRAKITDQNGVVIPTANNLVTFGISGPGSIAAVDNADNSSHESFQSDQRKAFEGECVAFVRATAPSGRIKLTATADNLASGSIIVRAAK